MCKCVWCSLVGEAERSVVECGGVDGVSSEGVEKVGVEVCVVWKCGFLEH